MFWIVALAIAACGGGEVPFDPIAPPAAAQGAWWAAQACSGVMPTPGGELADVHWYVADLSVVRPSLMGAWLPPDAIFVATALACAANTARSAPEPPGPTARVAALGYCGDVASAACAVGAWWPRSAGDANGVEGYWLASRDGRVCFVSRELYEQAVLGAPTACRWRERHS